MINLDELRKLMKINSINAYLIPHNDSHNVNLSYF